LYLYTLSLHDALPLSGAPVGLAEAVEAGIGFDLHQVPVPGAADDHALDVGDFDFLAQGGGGAGERGGEERGGAEEGAAGGGACRSEEHTSELQSPDQL